jgi:hypothetical protein
MFPKEPDSEGVGDFRTWEPSVQEVVVRVGRALGGRFDDERHTRFTQMFQDRFRAHDLAVGLKFIDNNTLKAMFAPTIPRWDMARVAVQAESEAFALFGRSIRVDIYETYITAPMPKLAEVRRTSPTGPVQVRFDPRFKIQQMNERRAKRAAQPMRRAAPPPLAPVAAPPTRLGGAFAPRQ